MSDGLDGQFGEFGWIRLGFWREGPKKSFHCPASISDPPGTRARDERVAQTRKFGCCGVSQGKSHVTDFSLSRYRGGVPPR